MKYRLVKAGEGDGIYKLKSNSYRLLHRSTAWLQDQNIDPVDTQNSTVTDHHTKVK